MKDTRTFSQRWADKITEFSGSWGFIIVFTVACILWVAANLSLRSGAWDPYPFLFLNWILTITSTLQNPLIMLSQNRQNENDRAREIVNAQTIQEMLVRMEKLQTTVNRLVAMVEAK